MARSAGVVSTGTMISRQPITITAPSDPGMNDYISKPIRVEELVPAVLGTPLAKA